MNFALKRYPTKSSPYDSKEAITQLKIHRVWGSDGWSYIPQLMRREKFTETQFFSEDWDGIIPLPLYSETLVRSVYSYAPQIWREQGETFDEIFEETISIQSK